jgi:hypothetical protein
MDAVLDKSAERARKGLGLIALTALLATLMLWISSTLSYATVKQLASDLSGHHQANRVTESFLAELRVGLRISSLALAGVAAGLLLLGRRLGYVVCEIWIALVQECKHAGESLQEIVAATTAGWRQGVLLVLVFGTAIALRVFYIGQPMRYDESYAFLMYARKGLLRTIALDYFPNNHLLHTELVWLVSRFLGSSPLALRLPALLAGLLLVAMVYLYAARRGSGSAGLFAAALVATNADLIMYSTNSRGYTLQAVLFFAQFQIANALGRTPRRIGLWIPFVALAVASLYTSPSMVYGVAVCATVALVGWWNSGERSLAQVWRLGSALSIAALITVLLYVPIILGSGARSLFANRYVTATPWAGLPGRIAESFGETWQTWNLGWPQPLAWVLAAGFVVCVIWKNKDYRPLLVGLAVCVILLFGQRVSPPPRVWLFLLPLYLLIAAEGLLEMLRRFAGTRSDALMQFAAVVILVGGSLSVIHSDVVPYMPETGVNPDAAVIATYLRGELKAGDLMIATLPVSSPVMYYGFRLGLSDDYWETPNPERVVVVIDKQPGPALNADQVRSGVGDAFSGAYTTARPEQFPIAGVLLETKYAEVVSLKKKLN